MIYIRSFRTWLFVFYVSLVLFISLTPGSKLNLFPDLWRIDKIIHFIEYLGVGFLLINMLMIKQMTRRNWQLALIFILIFPVIDESLQYYTPRRIPDIYDAVVDMIGGLCGFYLRKKL